MDERIELEAHMLRIRTTVEGWTEAEKAARCEEMTARLLEMGIAIDDEIIKAMEKFIRGTIGFEEFSKCLQGKI